MKRYIPNTIKRKIKNALKQIRDSLKYPYYYSRAQLKKRSIRNIVFVCKGNVCRSTFAEFYLNSRKIEDITAQSCGLDVDQGTTSPKEAIRAAKCFGINLEEHTSKPVSAVDIKTADIICPMEFNHYLRLKDMFPDKSNRIILLRKFAQWPNNLLIDIHDPYMGPPEEYHSCFSTIKKSIDNLIEPISTKMKQN